MGYNGSNRMPKFYIGFPKGLSNSDIGIILLFILIPIIAVIFIVQLIIGIIIELSDKKTNTNEDDEKTPSPYNKLMTNLSEVVKDINSTRINYLTIVKTNAEIKQKIKEQTSYIESFKRKLKWYGFIPPKKKKYLEGIKVAHREINRLKSLETTPIINLEEYQSTNHAPKRITGHCLLLINRILKTGDLLKEEEICRRLEDKRSFFETTKTPNLKLSFAPIELFFYDYMILLMAENDFLVLDRDEYEFHFRTETIKGIGVHYPRCSSIWHVSIIDIKIYSQTISIHFFKEQEGKWFYDIIQKSLIPNK